MIDKVQVVYRIPQWLPRKLTTLAVESEEKSPHKSFAEILKEAEEHMTVGGIK